MSRLTTGPQATREKRRAFRRLLAKSLRAGTAACVLAGGLSINTHAQTPGLPGGDSVPPGSRLLLSAERLIYNEREHHVVAEGKVRIDYGGYKLVAKTVEYDQDTHRMQATGEVHLINPDGTELYADTLDVTDDFSDGFANALRIDTPDRTHIVAESAERRGGVQTQVNNGVYTACEPCKEHPERAPFWQIKARKIIRDTDKQTVRLRNARFELFGLPLFFTPYLQIPDPSVKRKSGFLRPFFGYSDSLGFGAGIPYYQVISPYMDATIRGTGYTKQGFLAEGEFRQRFRNGFHTLTLAGIHQSNPDAFRAGSLDAENTNRGLIASRAFFEINRNWTAGWDLLAESDTNFGRTYGISGYADGTHVSDAYLNGLAGRNYFDLHGYYFTRQGNDDQSATSSNLINDQQPVVLPVVDYSYTPDRPVLGGEVNFTLNETTLWRDGALVDAINGSDPQRYRYPALEGSDSRLSAEVEWKRSFATPSGLVLTPIAAARGDAFFVNAELPAQYDNSAYPGDFAGDGTHTRGMVTAGLEARYPILATGPTSRHVIEPIAQVFVRPDEAMAGALPNEDSQSFVFDTSNLFSRNKFAGYDRVEGGTRANVGIRYTGTFEGGTTVQGVFGQSYQIAGRNSFDSPDLVYAGHDSGLDTDVSDYVGSLGFQLPNGISLGAGSRFDKESFERQRTSITAGYSSTRFNTSIIYSKIAPQPDYSSQQTFEEVTTAASLKFADNWRAFGAVTYNIEKTGVRRDSLGLAFNNECFALNLVYSETRNNDGVATGDNDWSIGATLSFRTLGDVKLGSTQFDRFQ